MNPKIVFINGRFLTQPATGVQRFAIELLKALDLILESDQTFSQKTGFICLIPKETEDKILPQWKNILIQKCGRLNGNLWEQIELPFYARTGLLVDLCNIGPIFHFNQLVVFHDASVFAVPEAYSLAFKVKYRFIMWVLGHTARQIITDSQFSRNELAKYLRIGIEKILIISLGCEHILKSAPDYSIIEKNNLSDKPFILAVGSSSPYKNVSSLIKVINKFHSNQINLVIAGGKYSKIFKLVEESDTENVIRLGYVTDSELRALYENALCFIFPSLYEGFGLPPLEAMACGCPVLSSNRASLPEICGDAALYFDPINEEEVYGTITSLIENTSLQNELRKKGLERAKLFTWENAAKFLIDALINSHLITIETSNR